MPSGLEQRYFAQHNANFNITSITDANGQAVERYVHAPHGSLKGVYIGGQPNRVAEQILRRWLDLPAWNPKLAPFNEW